MADALPIERDIQEHYERTPDRVLPQNKMQEILRQRREVHESVVTKLTHEQLAKFKRDIDLHQETGLADDVENFSAENLKQTIDRKLSPAATPAAAPAAAAPRGTLDTIIAKVEEYTKKIGDFMAPYLDKIQEVFSGPTGKLLAAFGIKAPEWAKPGAVELRQIKRLMKKDFPTLSLMDGEPADDKVKMRSLKDIFGAVDKTAAGAPQNLQEFFKKVIEKTQSTRGSADETTLTMEDLVDGAKAAFPDAARRLTTPAAVPPAAPPSASPDVVEPVPAEYVVPADQRAALTEWDRIGGVIITETEISSNTDQTLDGAKRLIVNKDAFLATQTRPQLVNRIATLTRVITAKKSDRGSDFNDETIKALKWLKYLEQQKAKTM